MKTLVKNRWFVFLMTVMMMLSILGCTLAFTPKKASAAEIDYVNQNYVDVPNGFDVTTSDVIFKIHCADITEHFEDPEYREDFGDYVTKISFRASMGCQIYFVEGKACDLEDSESRDFETSKYSNYYEILYYDDTNKNVYIKFKNLDKLDSDETVSADLEDLGLWQVNSTYLNKPQYIHLSAIEQPVTTITNEDVYFTTFVGSEGRRGWSDYNVCMLEGQLRINQKVAHLVDAINIEIVEGAEYFTLRQSSFTINDGFGEDGCITFDLYVIGDMYSITEKVKLKAKITYDEETIVVESIQMDLISQWLGWYSKNFSGIDIYDYNKEFITKMVRSHNGGFFREVKAHQNYFDSTDKFNTFKTTALIFRIPKENFKNFTISWSTQHYKGYNYFASIAVNADLSVQTSAYKMSTNEDGTVELATGEVTHDTAVENTLINCIEVIPYREHIYCRVTDELPITKYFPNISYRVTAWAVDNGGSSITYESNNAIVVHDELTTELRNEVLDLQAQIRELQALLDAAQASLEEMDALRSKADGLQVDNDNLNAQIAYMEEQIEVMRTEYQNKIDELIGQAGTTEGDSVPKEDVEPTEKSGLNAQQIVAISLGSVLLLGVVILLIPKKRRIKK